MIMLSTPVRTLEVVLSAAPATQLPWLACWNDMSATTFAPGANHGVTAGVSTVTMVAAPAAGSYRQLKFISIYNADSAVATVSIKYDDGGTERTIIRSVLSIGDTLEFIDSHGFKVLDNLGRIKMTGSGPSDLTLREVDLSPSVSGVSIVEFDQADGFVITNPGAGIARVDYTSTGGGGILGSWMV
jgi:hypothetical protein